MALVSGYGSDCFAPWARLFGDARDRAAVLGARLVDAPVSGLSSGAWNARVIADNVAGLALDPGERLALIGYSKGAPDVLEAMVAHPAETARVEAIVSVHGALRGAMLAESAPALLDLLAEAAPGSACGPSDAGARFAMRPEIREAWLADHAGRWRAPVHALAGFAERERVSAIQRHLDETPLPAPSASAAAPQL